MTGLHEGRQGLLRGGEAPLLVLASAKLDEGPIRQTEKFGQMIQHHHATKRGRQGGNQ